MSTFKKDAFAPELREETKQLDITKLQIGPPPNHPTVPKKITSPKQKKSPRMGGLKKKFQETYQKTYKKKKLQKSYQKTYKKRTRSKHTKKLKWSKT